MMQTQAIRPRARTEQLVIQTVSDETLVYDLETDHAFCLNPSAAFVWSVCDGDQSIDAIAKLTERKFGAAVGEDFVALALDQLSKNNLLENAYPVSSSQQRREWIKKVGMSSLLALPVIASLVSSTRAQFSSCACVNPGACLTQTTCSSQVNCNGSGVCAP
jgi:hypothetical protein